MRLALRRLRRHLTPLPHPFGGEYTHCVQPGIRGYGMLTDETCHLTPCVSQRKGYDGLPTGEELGIMPLS
jgi:hypothetical protein